MSKILVSPKIVDDALNNGYKYIENNEFEKGIKYLEFALQSIKKDQYLLYALIVSHYNMRNISRVKSYMKEIKEIKVDNVIIKDAIKQINKELKHKKTVVLDDVIPEKFLNNVENLEILRSKLGISSNDIKEIAKNSKDELYSFLSSPSFEADNYKFFEKQYAYFISSIINFEKFKNYYLEQANFNELKLYTFYNKSLKTIGHSAFIIKLSANDVLTKILQEDKVSKYLKNEIVYDLNLFIKKGYIKLKDLNDEVKENLVEVDLKKFKEIISSIEKELKNTPLYKEPKLFNYAMALIIKFFRTHVSTLEDYNKNKIIEKVLEYLYFSNIVINDELSKYINENYSIDKESYSKTVKEINKISLIL